MTEQVVTASVAGWTVTDETLETAHRNAIDVFDTDTALLAYDLRARIVAQFPEGDDGRPTVGDATIDIALTEVEWQALLMVLRREVQWSDGVADATATATLQAHIATIADAV